MYQCGYHFGGRYFPHSGDGPIKTKLHQLKEQLHDLVLKLNRKVNDWHLHVKQWLKTQVLHKGGSHRKG